MARLNRARKRPPSIVILTALSVIVLEDVKMWPVKRRARLEEKTDFQIGEKMTKETRCAIPFKLLD